MHQHTGARIAMSDHTETRHWTRTAPTESGAKNGWATHVASAIAAFLLGVLAAAIGMAPWLIEGPWLINAIGRTHVLELLPLDEDEFLPSIGILLVPSVLATAAWAALWSRAFARLKQNARWAVSLGLALGQGAALAQTATALPRQAAMPGLEQALQRRIEQEILAGIALALLAQVIFWLLTSRSLSFRLVGVLIPGFPVGLWLMTWAMSLDATGGWAGMTLLAPSLGVGIGLALAGTRQTLWVLHWAIGVMVALFFAWAVASSMLGSSEGALSISWAVALLGMVFGIIIACLAWAFRRLWRRMRRRFLPDGAREPSTAKAP